MLPSLISLRSERDTSRLRRSFRLSVSGVVGLVSSNDSSQVSAWIIGGPALAKASDEGVESNVALVACPVVGDARLRRKATRAGQLD